MADMRSPTAAELEPYARAGITLIPLHPWDKKDARGREIGKAPRHRDWTTRPYANDAVIADAVRDGTNVGARLSDEIVVVDVDPRNMPDGRNVLAELDMEVGLRLETAPHTITGSGGDHYWFTKPVGVSLVDSLPDFPGIEFKSKGRQVVAAGSWHPCGKQYVWDDFAPPLTQMPALPQRVLALATRPPPSAQAGTGGGELTPGKLADLLDMLNAEDFREHDAWRDMMMSCHHATAGEGRQEFIDWSTSDPQYAKDAWIIGRRWDSLHLDRGGGSVTIRYLYRKLLDAGHKIPNTDPEDDFSEARLPEEGDDAVAPTKGLLEAMNDRHCCVMEGGKFRVFTEMRDPVLDRQYYARSVRNDFVDYYGNRSVEAGDSTVPLGVWWLKHANRRQYEGLIFDPEHSHKGFLNLWKGWDVEPKQGDWSLLRTLLREVLCDDHAPSFEYVMNWSANMVQHPGSPAEVAIAFRGDKGTGKGTFGRALVGLAGAHGLHISSPGHITGRFNAHLKDCVALFADEAFWAGDKAGESVLKQLVTEPTVTYEGKGRDAETGRNLIHIVLASNSDWVVPAGIDGERRFAVFEVNNKAQADKTRFSAIYKQLAAGGLQAMLYELLMRDIRGWAPRDDVPQTKALIDQKLRSLSELESWWHECLCDGILSSARGDWREGEVIVPKTPLREDYQRYARAIGVRRLATETTFGQILNKLVPGLEHKQVKALDTELDVRVDSRGRTTAYAIPRLSVCRKAFDRKLGGAGVWPD